MPAQGASQASTPPDKSHTEDRKRKRDVLSCLDCRRRKLKCDRGFPACGRCVKGGVAASCTYKSFSGGNDSNNDEPNALVDENGRVHKRARGHFGARLASEEAYMGRELVPVNNTHSASTCSSHKSVIKSLENRLGTLESMLTQSSTVGNFPLQGPRSITTVSNPAARGIREPETHLFKGRGVRTQFYGPSNPTSLLVHFPEVRTFMKEAHANSNLQRLQNECNVADAKLKGSLSKSSLISTVNLHDLVPERSVADPLVRLYFETFEMTYRILHRHTFWRDYESFWSSPGQGSRGFVPVLLLTMAVVLCISPKKPLSFTHEGSSLRTEAVQWIRACDYWFTQQSSKHRFLAMYQVMCLRFLAASANSLKAKEAYLGAENLLSYFKAAGMHRDPHLLGDRCSPYEMEMRRRLWFTAMELELQASIDRGMPSSLGGLTADCPPPLNINDDLFDETSMQLPTSRPAEEYTETSFLDVSSRSMPLRIALCSLVNDTGSSMPYDDVLEYEQQVAEALDAIPRWDGSQTTQVSTLLDLQLRQFFLLIHTPFARKAASSHSRYSRMVCFETAQQIITQHFKLISSNNFTISLVRDDVYRSALSMCHNAFLCSLSPKDMFFQGVLINFPLIMDEAFKVIEEKCMRRGEGFQYYWHVSATYGLVRLRMGHENFDAAKIQATDRIAKLYQKVLAFQEAPRRPSTMPPSAAPPIAEGGSTTPASWYYSANVLGFTNNEAVAPVNYPDAFDYSDWTLDNLWPLDASNIEQDMNIIC